MSDSWLHQKSKKTQKVINYFLDKTSETIEFLRTLFPKAYHLNPSIEILTNLTTDVIYRLRYSDMKYEYINSSISKLLGYDVKELEEIGFRSLILDAKIYTDKGIKDLTQLEQLENERKIGKVHRWEADYQMKIKDGNTLWLADVSYPWYDEHGNIIGSIGCLRDVTCRVKAETESKNELVRLANTDPLTKLANRRYFFDHLDLELKRVQRTDRELSVLLLDIDFFKRINDTYGHFVGDKILVEVAAKIRVALRETDIAARLGGEEFGIFLPDTPLTGAYWVADRICDSIAKHQFSIEGVKEAIRCTVSIGVSCSSVYEKPAMEELYKIADSRLFIAKNTGRNQVSIDEIVSIH